MSESNIPETQRSEQTTSEPSTTEHPIATIGVVGGGTMGLGIAYVFALAGWDVQVVEPSDDQATRMEAEHGAAIAGSVQRGKLDVHGAARVLARLQRIVSVDQLPEGLPIVIESVPERLDLKRSVLQAIEQRSPRVIGTNTSSISIGLLGQALSDPARLIGTHFFNPVWSLPLVELVVSEHTADGIITEAERIMSEIGKQTIVARDVPGFATSRIDLAAALEAMRMLEDAVASADDIDRAAVLAYRHPVGPLRLSDIVGLDVRLDIARQLEPVYGERFRAPQILIDLVEQGHLGRKSGRGFHEWPPEVEGA